MVTFDVPDQDHFVIVEEEDATTPEQGFSASSRD
jgi:hypothetical protein